MRFLVIEKNPDTKLRLGKIDADGDRILWVKAGSEDDLLAALQERGVSDFTHWDHTRLLPHRRVDLDVTGMDNDRTVTSGADYANRK